jgi:hypothetical protein
MTSSGRLRRRMLQRLRKKRGSAEAFTGHGFHGRPGPRESTGTAGAAGGRGNWQRASPGWLEG